MMAHAYGTCRGCGEWGALWKRYVLVRRFLLFGAVVRREVYRCDECDARKNWPKDSFSDDNVAALSEASPVETIQKQLAQAERALESARAAQVIADESARRAQLLLDELSKK